MSDAFRESNSNTYRNIVTFQSGFGVIADEPFNVGSPTTTNSILNTYNPIKPFGGVSGYVPYTGTFPLLSIRTPYTISGQGFYIDLINGFINNSVNGNNLIDIGNNQLISSTSEVTADWSVKQLFHNGDPSVDWANYKLMSAGNALSLDWNNKILTGTWAIQNLTITGKSIATGGPYYPLSSNPQGYIPSGSGMLVDSGNKPSVDWINRRLFGTGSTGNGTGTSVSGVKLDWSGANIKIPSAPKGPNGLYWAYEDPTNSGNNFYVSASLSRPDSSRFGICVANASGNTDYTWGFQLHSSKNTIMQGYNNLGSAVIDSAGAMNLYATSLSLNANTTIGGSLTVNNIIDSDFSTTAIQIQSYHYLNNFNGNVTVDFGNGALWRDDGATQCMDWFSSNLIGAWTADSLSIGGQAVTTGGPYYPLLSNPSGYITTGQTGSFGTATNTGVLTGAFYPRTGNPSGFLTSGAINGSGTFITGKIIRTNELRIGVIEDSVGNPLMDSVGAIYDINDLQVFVPNSYQLISNDTSDLFTSLDWSTRQLFYHDGVTKTLDWENRVLSGNWKANGLSISGNNVLTGTTLPSINVTTSINWASANTFYVTLTGNTTFTFTGQKDGQTIVVSVNNTGTNHFTGSWPSGTKWPFGTAPTQTSGSFTDIYTFVDITGTIYGNAVQGY